jgi:alkylation response protein AidB-like acyl-CoA dehydrogenase
VILRDEDLVTWQQVVRDFLAAVEIRVRPPGPRVDRTLWRRACALGVAGLDVPEALGGTGAGFGALAVVQRECGRVLAPLPVLGSVVAAQGIILAAGGAPAPADPGPLADLLPGLLSGDLIAAAVLDAPDVTVDGGRLTGRLAHVMDGMSADLLVLLDAGSRPWVVDFGADGVHREVAESMDLVRDFATVTLEAAPARPLGQLAPEQVARVRRAVAAAVACEQHGGSEATLESAVAYTRTRVQFGRVIGSFQAIKHRCADLAVEVDLSLSAVAHAAWAVQEDAPQAPLAVAMAGATCPPAFLRCALENVQLHGGIGFTWEHPAQLYVRRAESDLALFGDAEQHREGVLHSLGI